MSQQRSPKGKVTICIVNTYDKLKWHDIHSRNIARAAPLCYYTGFDLCLFDFPFKEDYKEFLLKEVKENTTIGDGGKYIEELIKHGKIVATDDPNKLKGVFISTTSKPEKNCDLDTIAKNIREGDDSVLFIGLGRRGLPREIRKMTTCHLDITGEGISLETCTAIGFIIGRIYEKINL
ncbi:MAG TPA: DUF531 family protein [Methanofastidiosum sp.]|nr:DUF531 family protein [Methanofastidiosum sp.]